MAMSKLSPSTYANDRLTHPAATASQCIWGEEGEGGGGGGEGEGGRGEGLTWVGLMLVSIPDHMIQL